MYTALDPATEETGAVHLIPGSHKLGCINPSHHSGFLTPEQAEQHCPAEKAITLELLPGDVALLHNYSEASPALAQSSPLLPGSDLRSDPPVRPELQRPAAACLQRKLHGREDRAEHGGLQRQLIGQTERQSEGGGRAQRRRRGLRQDLLSRGAPNEAAQLNCTCCTLSAEQKTECILSDRAELG